jgi:hypothetical protein
MSLKYDVKPGDLLIDNDEYVLKIEGMPYSHHKWPVYSAYYQHISPDTRVWFTNILEDYNMIYMGACDCFVCASKPNTYHVVMYTSPTHPSYVLCFPEEYMQKVLKCVTITHEGDK